MKIFLVWKINNSGHRSICKVFKTRKKAEYFSEVAESNNDRFEFVVEPIDLEE